MGWSLWLSRAFRYRAVENEIARSINWARQSRLQGRTALTRHGRMGSRHFQTLNKCQCKQPFKFALTHVEGQYQLGMLTCLICSGKPTTLSRALRFAKIWG